MRIRIIAVIMPVFLILCSQVMAATERGPMMPIAPLMIEHRLIERMIIIVEEQTAHFRQTGEVDLVFLDSLIDFIRFYADKVHHGKEEDILFAELRKKDITPAHKAVMEELLQEHRSARALAGQLDAVTESYRSGDKGSLPEICTILEGLSSIYRGHIIKEDRHFFLPVMNYFSREEQNAMLQEMWEFDRTMIHVKYREVVRRSSERIAK